MSKKRSKGAGEPRSERGNGIAYIEKAIERGLDVDEVAPRVSFFLNAHNNFLEEIAKFRAARRMWAGIMRRHFKAQNPRSWTFRFHTQTAGSTLTAQQPDTNIVRVALQALASVLGGTQSLHSNSRDEALALPTEESALLALRTQQIIAYESGVTNTVDPVAGSYTIEKLTNHLQQVAETYLEKIDAMGGMLAAIEKGFVQREIQHAAYEYQAKIENGSQVIVGVNRYQKDAGLEIPILRIDPEIERQQVARLKELREARDGARVAAALQEIEVTAKSERNLMPPILEAVKAYATVGEISSVLGGVFGQYKEAVVI